MIRNAALVGGLGIAWGLNWPAVRLALGELSPLTMRAMAFTAAASLMFAFVLATGGSLAVPRRHWLRLAIVGAFSIVAYNLFSAFAQLSASTSRSAVLSYTMPIWTVLLARFVLGERIDARRAVGLGLGVAGLLALGLPVIRDGELSWGLFHAVMSGIVWAAGNVILKRWPIAAAPLVIAAWQIALGAILLIGGTLAIEGWPKGLPVHAETWLGLGYNIVIGQAVATTLWFTILDRMPAGIASIASLIVPGIGVIGATLILGEHPTTFDWIGLVLIVAASATVLLRPATDRSPSGPKLAAAPNRSAVT